MAYGISQEVDQLQGLSIQELMRKHSVDPKLVYAIALQEKTKMEDAKNRQSAMAQQPPQPADLVGQMEVGLARAPQTQMSMSPPQGQMQPPQGSQAGAGIASLPAANMAKMAGGGIVAFAEGGAPTPTKVVPRPVPMGQPSVETQAAMSDDVARYIYNYTNLRSSMEAATDPQQKAAINQQLQEMQRTFSPDIVSEAHMKMSQQSGMAGGGVVAFAKGEEVEVKDEDKTMRAALIRKLVEVGMSPEEAAVEADRTLSRNLIPDFTAPLRAVTPDFTAPAEGIMGAATAPGRAVVGAAADLMKGDGSDSRQGQYGLEAAANAAADIERPSIGEAVRTGVGNAREFMADRNDNTGQAATLRGVGQGISEIIRGRGTIGQNNPFNLRDYNQNWEGQTGATEGFVDYGDERSGVRAADKLLENYGKQGVVTIRDIVSKFAPANENDTEAYIEFVSNQTGIPSEQPIDMGNAVDRRKVLAAMGQMESGYKTDADEITAMLSAGEAVGTDEALLDELRMAGSGLESTVSQESIVRDQAPRDRLIQPGSQADRLRSGITSIPRRVASQVSSMGDAVIGAADNARDAYQNASSDGSGMSPEELAAAYAMVDEASAEKPGYGTTGGVNFLRGVGDYYERIKSEVEGQDNIPGKIGAGLRATGDSAAEIGGNAVDLAKEDLNLFLEGFRGGAPTGTGEVIGTDGAGNPIYQSDFDRIMGRTPAPSQEPSEPTAIDKLKSAAVPVETPPSGQERSSGISAATPTGGRGKLDKLMGVLEVLGRGAGTSKGYEFSKIADETSKIRAAEADRDARKEERQLIIDANQLIANQEASAKMATQAMAAMQVDPAYNAALTALEAEFTRGGNDYVPFNEEFDQAGFDAAKRTLEQEYIANYAATMRGNTSMAQFGGASGQPGVEEASSYFAR